MSNISNYPLMSKTKQSSVTVGHTVFPLLLGPPSEEAKEFYKEQLKVLGYFGCGGPSLTQSSQMSFQTTTALVLSQPLPPPPPCAEIKELNRPCMRLRSGKKVYKI